MPNTTISLAGHEDRDTYQHARKWTPWLEQRGIPVVTLHPENNQVVREDSGTTSSVQIPALTLDKLTAQHGSINRQYTRHWKIIPIRRHQAAPNRDGWRCLRCGESWQVTVDHIGPIHIAPEMDMENSQTLCEARHLAKTPAKRRQETPQRGRGLEHAGTSLATPDPLA